MHPKPSEESIYAVSLLCCAVEFSSHGELKSDCSVHSLRLMGNGNALTLVTVEISQILEELVSVAHQNVNDGASLVGVGDKHLQASYRQRTFSQDHKQSTVTCTACLAQHMVQSIALSVHVVPTM